MRWITGGGLVLMFGLAAGCSSESSVAAHRDTALCKKGESCDFGCDGHNCEHVCKAGSDCRSHCDRGSCVQTCEKGATCQFTCEGGHCDQTCDEGANCQGTCEGGGCQHHCLGTECDMTCEDVCACVGEGCSREKALAVTWAADLDDVTEKVVAGQDIERQDDQVFLDDGHVMVGSTLVQLHTVEANPCLDALISCDISDVELMGIGPSALVADLSTLRESIRNQGSRGTCVAHAINAGVEVLAARKGLSLDLSEQATYWLGHELEQDWNAMGLHTSEVVEGIVAQEVRMHAEDTWPYNPQLECEEYRAEHPGTTCTASETQGSGEGGCDLPGELDQEGAVSIVAFRTLYRSLGRLKLALYQGHPVVLGVNAALDLMRAELYGGVVTDVLNVSGCEDGPCGHAMLAVGYADDSRVDGGGYVIVKNSWGHGWGDDGLGYLTYAYLEREFLDATAIIAIE